jgi:DNA-binding response OmpR family regulator
MTDSTHEGSLLAGIQPDAYTAQPSAAPARDGEDSILSGKKVLIVEDEAIISFLLEDMVTSLGCEDITLAGNVKNALAQIDAAQPEAAILDVNLGGEMAYPVAETLRAIGVPFVFTTGYGRGGVKPEWAGYPVVQKPFNIEALGAALRSILVVAS